MGKKRYNNKKNHKSKNSRCYCFRKVEQLFENYKTFIDWMFQKEKSYFPRAKPSRNMIFLGTSYFLSIKLRYIMIVL